MAVFVLVHGGFHGGWCWRRVTPHLRAAGHEVYTPTLTGLGERAHLATPETGLDTHIRDVLGVLAFEDLRDVILVGHSMAGMVVTGVAERDPDRLAYLVYLDASVPRDGECDLDCHEEIRGDARAAFEARAGRDGRLPPRLRAHLFGIASAEDSAWVNEKLTPHPIKAFTDPVRVTDAARFAGRRTFVYCSTGDIAVWSSRMVARVRAEPGWRNCELATGHDAMITMPRELAELLLTLA
jgi:pimeloyl-ACP methyl ester carboxylesterase